MTLEDAHRFVKYIQAQVQSDQNTNLLPPPKYGLHQDDTPGDADESDEEDILDDQSYLTTPEPTSPELNSRIIKPGPFLSPTLHHLPPLSSSLPTQLPRDPRALLELLRSHLSTDDLKQLLQGVSNDVTSMSQPSVPSVDPVVFNHLGSPESQPHSPIPSSSHKPSPSFAHSRLSSPGEIIVSSDSTHNPSRTGSVHSSSPHTQIPPEKSTVTPSPGFISREIFMDLSKLFFKATGDHISPDQFLKRFELCQKKSQELTTALERGNLRDFGMLPSEELKALGHLDSPKLSANVAPS